MARPIGTFKSLPEYRLHKPSGQAVVTLSGEMHYLGVHGTATSKTKYDRLLAEWIAIGRQPLRASNRTVTEVVAAFWAHAKTYYLNPDGSPSGELENYRCALRPLRRMYGENPAEEFGPLALKTLIGELVKPQRVKGEGGKAVTRSGWSRNYANRQLSRIKSVWKWAVGAELLPAHLYQSLLTVPGLRRGKSAARETDPVKPVPQAYVDAALKQMPRQIKAMVELQSLTGMRPGEVCRMRGCDIDTDNGGAMWTYRPPQHKQSHLGYERVIDLGPRAQKILEPFLKPDVTAYLFSPADAERERRDAIHQARKTPLSCGNKPGSNRRRKPKRQPGQSYTVGSYRQAIARACDKADAVLRAAAAIAGRQEGEAVPRWAPNRIRHNAATRLRKHFGIETARVILGHESEDMTAVYAERDRAKARDAMKRIG